MNGHEYRERIARIYRRRRLQQILILPVLGPAVLLFMWMLREGPDDWCGVSRYSWLALSGGLFLFWIAFSYFNWRCPACGGYFGRRFIMRLCPRCGASLTADDGPG